MREISGTIEVVQESRFRVREGSGRWWLMILAAQAAIEPQDLPALCADGVVVRVRYEPCAERIAGVAHEVTRGDGAPRHLGNATSRA
jgi:hypothetical protein